MNCTIDGCDRPLLAKGLCRLHYDRQWRYGRTELLDRVRPPENRFWEKVDKNGPIPERRPDLGPCWIWTATLSGPRGPYGQFFDGVRVVPAHRFAYELLVGPIPDGHHLDHICLNPPCVRPSHTEPVTLTENNRRAAKIRLESPEYPCGHPRIADRPGKCPVCERERTRKWVESHREESRVYMREYMRKRRADLRSKV